MVAKSVIVRSFALPLICMTPLAGQSKIVNRRDNPHILENAAAPLRGRGVLSSFIAGRLLFLLSYSSSSIMNCVTGGAGQV
jgi:hypothetical protein